MERQSIYRLLYWENCMDRLHLQQWIRRICVRLDPDKVVALQIVGV